MKKILLTISVITLASSYFFGQQCKTSLYVPNSKICSNEYATLTANPSFITSVPNTKDSSEVFNLSTIKEINQTVVTAINSGLGGSFISIPIPDFSKETTMDLNGIKLTNTIVTSGSLNLKYTTNLNQDLTIIFELPYFKINGKSLKDTILIKGDPTAKAGNIFTDIVNINLKNAIIDFTAGNPLKYNVISYKITSSVKLSTKIFTGKETGSLKVELKDLKFAENITYTWFKNKTKLIDATPNITVKDAGKYFVETTSNCGTVKDSIEITVVEKPSNKLSVNGNIKFCEGKDKTILKAVSNPKYTYKWTNASIDSNVTITKSGDYSATITNDICVTQSEVVKITVVEVPSNKININGPLTFCEGKNKTILKAASNPKYTYKWSNASIDSNVTITKSGDYSATITNDICATLSEVIKIKVNPNPVIKLSKKDTTIYKGDIVKLKVSGASSYLWNTNSKSDTISIKEAGTYKVVGTNEFGCTSSDSMKLSVKVKTTGITDLASDKFQVYPNPASNNVYISVANFTNTTLRMYDLIGNEVFHQVIKNEVTEVSVNQFAKGMYLVKIENANSNTIESKRLVVE
jgi:ribosomal protein L24E